MSKLGKKVSAAANQATGVLVRVGARQGKTGLVVANAVTATLLGTYVRLCPVDCSDPTHEHVDFKLR